MTHPPNNADQPQASCDALRELAKAASPGPWTFKPNTCCPGYDIGGGVMSDKWTDRIASDWLRKEDGEFIAAANPSAVLALLDELAAVTRERDEWKAKCNYGRELDAENRSDMNDTITHWREVAEKAERERDDLRIKGLQLCKQNGSLLMDGAATRARLERANLLIVESYNVCRDSDVSQNGLAGEIMDMLCDYIDDLPMVEAPAAPRGAEGDT